MARAARPANYDSAFYGSEASAELREETLRLARVEEENDRLRARLKSLESALKIAGKVLLPYAR